MTVTFTIYVDTLEASAEGARRGGEEGEMEKEVKTAKKSEGDGDGGGGYEWESGRDVDSEEKKDERTVTVWMALAGTKRRGISRNREKNRGRTDGQLTYGVRKRKRRMDGRIGKRISCREGNIVLKKACTEGAEREQADVRSQSRKRDRGSRKNVHIT